MGKGREKISYWKAEESVVDLANKLIVKHNKNAVDANICYLFRSKHAKRGGKMILGRTKKESDKAKMLHGYDYIIELAADAWTELDNTQREALLLHEILHIAAEEDDSTGDIKFGINQHDTEEFRLVIESFGLWTPDLIELAKTLEARAAMEGKKSVVKKKAADVEEIKFDDDDDGIFSEEVQV